MYLLRLRQATHQARKHLALEWFIFGNFQRFFALSRHAK